MKGAYTAGALIILVIILAGGYFFTRKSATAPEMPIVAEVFDFVSCQ
jgi:hypothetical protein